MNPIIIKEKIIPYKPNFLVHTPNKDTIERRYRKSRPYVYGLIYDMNHLYSSFRKASKGSNWKKSVQVYEKNAVYNLYKLYNRLINKTYEQKEFYEFTLCERGKTRSIKAMYIEDRIVQRTLSDYVLTPIITDYLIYDNPASLKGKGIDFCRKRLETHFHRFYRKYRRNGYILKIDFSKFFDNLLHSYSKKIMHDIIDDENILWLIDLMIDSFKQDISYMEDDEYAQCLLTTFNSLDHQFYSEGHKTGEKIMEKSVGIGSHISQLCGILYPTEMDNYCKIVKGLKYYGRYMDDIYIIHENKRFLQDLLVYLDNLCRSIGLFINPKKTRINPIRHGFTYLQIKYNLTDSGHIIRRPTTKTFTRERHRLKSFYRLLSCERISLPEIARCYRSWRGNLKKYDAYVSLQSMDRYFYQIFGIHYNEIDINPVHSIPEYSGLDRKYFYFQYYFPKES